MLVIAFDIGGTNIRAGVVDTDNGRVLAQRNVPTEPWRGGPAVLDTCVALAGELSEAGETVAVGIGICELVAPGGKITTACALDWRAVRLKTAFAHLGPVVVEADVRAGALAEASFGAGRQFNDFIYVTVGTGISACPVIDRRPYAGARGNAQIVGSAARPVESVASGPALAAACGVDTAEDAIANAAVGDVRAIAALDAATGELGHALGVLANILDPEAIVIAGGLGLVDSYFSRVVTSTREEIWASDTRRLPLVRAGLGTDAGLVGAALVAAGQTNPGLSSGDLARGNSFDSLPSPTR